MMGYPAPRTKRHSRFLVPVGDNRPRANSHLQQRGGMLFFELPCFANVFCLVFAILGRMLGSLHEYEDRAKGT